MIRKLIEQLALCVQTVTKKEQGPRSPQAMPGSNLDLRTLEDVQDRHVDDSGSSSTGRW